MGEPISTHAPLQGATTVAFMLRRPPYFNSRTRVWCDRIRSAQGNRSFQLTHPVRGATIASDVQPCNIFQLPHPVRGATQTIMCFPPHIQKLAIKFFNSRTPRGVRPGSAWIQTGFSHFNSRTRVGCDNTDRSSLHNGLVFSTHAPHEGCDGSVCPR